ncbi:uncharacterized protein LOC143433471 [Xylocopa sonorina]|uniref:uncharacterized protein LOC143433471 n=1 Tax=Xylocopa sonorina TaxID=1818115 RepID=UPI00403ABBEF
MFSISIVPMDSIWITRPFTVSNDGDLTQGEPSCCEIHRFQEICRIKELMRRQACLNGEEHQSNIRISPKSCTRTWTNWHNCLGQKFQDDEREIHFQVASRSVSCLQRKVISSSSILSKMRSRTSLKDSEDIENNYFSNTLNLLKREKCGNSSRKTEESQIFPRRMQNEEDRDIGDALFSCPFELVEIYSSKKRKTSENDCNKTYDTLNRGTSSMRAFPKEDGEECKIVPEKNDFLLSQLKSNEVKDEIYTSDSKTTECIQENSKIEYFHKNYATEDKSKFDEDFQKKCSKEDAAKLDDFQRICSKKDEDKIDESLRKNNEKNIVEPFIYKRLSNFDKFVDGVASANKEENGLSSLKEENYEKRCREDNSNSDSRNPSGIHSDILNESFTHSSESKISKITLQSEESSILKDSKSDSLSMGKAADSGERKSNFGRQIVVEKQRNNVATNIVDNDKNDSLKCFQSSRVGSKMEEKEDSLGCCKRTTKINIVDAKHEAAQDSRSISLNYKDINICEMLTRIHERLTCDWQRMERLQMKLQGTVLINSANSMMTLQLLKKTIARCKSYFHSSSHSCEAESEMAKLLSKYIVNLVRIVNNNRITLEENEKCIDEMQLELLQGRHVVKKGSVLNEIILITNYWTNKISCLIKDISCLVENEEKENVRSPRRYKAMQRRMGNSSSINDPKQKAGRIRPKYVRPSLTKKESAIETQMSFVSNTVNALRQSKSKILAKPLHSSKGSRKEKHLDDTQASIIDKKVIDSNRHPERVKPSKILLNTNANQYKQSVYRQKHRTSCNQQPVWRPGGAVRTPLSNSTTVLSQKTRVPMHAREKGNLDTAKTSAMTHKRGNSMDHILTKKSLMNVEKASDDNGKRLTKMHYYISEETHGRRANESRKRPSSEILNVDSSKMAGKRSNTSLKVSPKTKSKPRSTRLPSKDCNEDACSDRTFPQNLDVLRALKQTNIIPPQMDDEEKSENQLYEPSLVKEKMKISEEEPTRDVDSNQCTRNQSSINEKMMDHQMMDKLEEKPLIPVTSKDFIPFLATDVKETAENTGLKRTDNFEALKSFPATFNSISTSTTFYQEPKSDKSEENDISRPCMLDRNENQQEECGEKSKICNDPSVIKKGKSVVNSHAVSLSMLKEFLYEQGIDVDLVNKAEKYLKDKQRTRRYLKKKSISFADVPSSVEHSKNWETAVRSERREEKGLQDEMRRSENDFAIDKNDSNQSSPQSLPKTKDTATSTVKDSINASSQTDVHCKASKCLQTISENNALTETEMQVIQRQTKIERKNGYSMTESHSISCGSAESDPSKNDKLRNANNFHLKPAETTKSTNSVSTECEINNDKNLSKECYLVLEQLSNNMRQECDESLMNYKSTDSADQLRSIESNSSLSSDSLDSSVGSSERNLGEIVTKDEGQSPIRVVSSEMVAALQVAVIRARNIYRAIDIYKRKLDNDAKRLRKRSKRGSKISQVSEACKEELTHVSRSNSVVKIVLQRKKSDRSDVIKMCRVLKQAEVASALSETSFDFDSESEEDVFKSVDTSLKCVSSDEGDLGIAELAFPKRSSSSVVLRDAKSVVEFLINETDHIRFESIGEIQKWSNSNTCVRFHGNWEVEAVRTKKRFSLFSRENLLPLIYGIMCSIVFWCLQFTITCDVVS